MTAHVDLPRRFEALDRYAAWDLVFGVGEGEPLLIDLAGAFLSVQVEHRREVERSSTANPFGVQVLPVGVESNRAEVVVYGMYTVSYGDVARTFRWKPGFVSDVRWAVAEYIEGLTG